MLGVVAGGERVAPCPLAAPLTPELHLPTTKGTSAWEGALIGWKALRAGEGATTPMLGLRHGETKGTYGGEGH